MARHTFHHRTVLVTGAAGGLGRALVERFGRAGARVGALDVDADGLDEAMQSWKDAGLQVEPAVVDLTQEESTRRAVERLEARLGPVHTLVANAGITHIRPFAADQAAAVRRVMEVNFAGTVNATAACYDSVVEQEGLFVALSSVAGFAPLVGRTGYAASKHALHGFFDTLRLELRHTGAGVLVVAPSYLATGIRQTQDVDDDDVGVRHEQSPEDAADRIVRAAERGRRFLPLGRVARISWWLRRWCPRLYERLMLGSWVGVARTLRAPTRYNSLMPTVLRSGPYRFYFFSHEPNEPPHVHVDRDAESAKFWLDPVALARNHGFRDHELRDIERLIIEHRDQLLEAWNGYHGDSR